MLAFDLFSIVVQNFEKIQLTLILISEIALVHLVIKQLINDKISTDNLVPIFTILLCIMGVSILLFSGYSDFESKKHGYTAAYAAFLNMTYFVLIFGCYGRFFKRYCSQKTS